MHREGVITAVGRTTAAPVGQTTTEPTVPAATELTVAATTKGIAVVLPYSHSVRVGLHAVVLCRRSARVPVSPDHLSADLPEVVAVVVAESSAADAGRHPHIPGCAVLWKKESSPYSKRLSETKL